MKRLAIIAPARGTHGGVARSTERLIAAARTAADEVVVARIDQLLFPGDTRIDPATGDVRIGVPELHEPASWLAALAPVIAPCDAVAGYYATTFGWAATRFGKPSLVGLRGNDIDRDLDDPRTRDTLAAATIVTVVSREMAGKLARPAHVVTSGVDRARFYFDAAGRAAMRDRWRAGERRVLGMFGELKAKRGLDRLRDLALDPAAWCIALVGTVRAEVAELVDPGWIHERYLEDDTPLRAAYAACDVVVQPSHADGLPNVVLEAMACERRVLASPVGGMRDVLPSAQLCADREAWLAALAAIVPGEHASYATLPTLANEAARLVELLGMMAR